MTEQQQKALMKGSISVKEGKYSIESYLTEAICSNDYNKPLKFELADFKVQNPTMNEAISKSFSKQLEAKAIWLEKISHKRIVVHINPDWLWYGTIAKRDAFLEEYGDASEFVYVSRTEFEALNNKVVNLESENTQLKNKVELFESENTQLKNKVELLQSENTQLKEEVQILKAENTSLKQRVTELEEEVKSLKTHRSQAEQALKRYFELVPRVTVVSLVKDLREELGLSRAYVRENVLPRLGIAKHPNQFTVSEWFMLLNWLDQQRPKSQEPAETFNDSF